MFLESGWYEDESGVAGVGEGAVGNAYLLCVAVTVGAGPAHEGVDELLDILEDEKGDFLLVLG